MGLKTLVNKIFGNELAQETVHKATSNPQVELKNIGAFIRRISAEGMVLLKNDGALPLKGKTAVFGRCQIDTFYVGYGSGGDVKPPYKVSIIDGLISAEQQSDMRIDRAVLSVYKSWCNSHKPYDGTWGHWPMCFPEMPIDEDTVKISAKTNDTAVVIIGRSAGEDRENKLIKGSYYLTDKEKKLLALVTENFNKTVVVLNCGNIIDLSWIEDYKISSVLYAWQGGMETGNALADVLTGKVDPCGKLTATIAKNYNDYPSAKCFGNLYRNKYVEDIFVGYRYFETFAKEKVLYPFGFGLSYTSFKITVKSYDRSDDRFSVHITVQNIGKTAGKEVVQLYAKAPQGKLGKADCVLTAFAKTHLLSPKETQTLTLSFNLYDLASYDDEGITGNKHCYVLEPGEYRLFVGSDIRSLIPVATFRQDELLVLKRLQAVCGVRHSFARYHAYLTGDKVACELKAVPTCDYDLKKRIEQSLPKPMGDGKDRGYVFSDILTEKITVDEFVGQLNLSELESLTRGHGMMNSPFGAEGNAGTFGGIISSLRQKGVPSVTTTDGPAGIRLAVQTSLLPCGTALASSWDTEAVQILYGLVAEEMKKVKTDVLLGPGMNIMRNPLCGRNFEYFSEDPLLTGKMAAAFVNGIQGAGVAACPKHFACNNQETRRNRNDSRVSERALREIYLKGFEICVEESKPLCIMTAYNKINGVWCHYNYDLATVVLREEWKYKGLVITDWWMRRSASREFPKLKNNAYRVRSQVDVLMPGNMNYNAKDYVVEKSLTKTIGQEEGITRAELERSAKNTLNFIIRLKSGVGKAND